MSKTVIGLVIATLVCGSASAYLLRELQAERTQAHELRERVAQLEHAQSHAPSVVQMEPAAPPPPQPVEPPATAAIKARPAITATAGPSAVLASNAIGMRMDPDIRGRMQESFEEQRRLLKDPEYRELMRSQQKLGMKQMYGDMELMLGLSKEEADHVLDILAEQQLRAREQRPFMPGMDGSQPDAQAIREHQRAFEEQKRTDDAELAAALGPKYGEWQSYQQNMWSRSQVMQLREALAVSNEPLRQDQIKPLVDALAIEQQQMQRSTGSQLAANMPMTRETQLRMQEEWLERMTQSHERIRNAVSSLLSPSQLEQLKEQQDQQRKMQELNLRMQRARLSEAQANGNDPSGPITMGATNSLVVD